MRHRARPDPAPVRVVIRPVDLSDEWQSSAAPGWASVLEVGPSGRRGGRGQPVDGATQFW